MFSTSSSSSIALIVLFVFVVVFFGSSSTSLVTAQQDRTSQALAQLFANVDPHSAAWRNSSINADKWRCFWRYQNYKTDTPSRWCCSRYTSTSVKWQPEGFYYDCTFYNLKGKVTTTFANFLTIPLRRLEVYNIYGNGPEKAMLVEPPLPRNFFAELPSRFEELDFAGVRFTTTTAAVDPVGLPASLTRLHLTQSIFAAKSNAHIVDVRDFQSELYSVVFNDVVPAITLRIQPDLSAIPSSITSLHIKKQRVADFAAGAFNLRDLHSDFRGLNIEGVKPPFSGSLSSEEIPKSMVSMTIIDHPNLVGEMDFACRRNQAAPLSFFAQNDSLLSTIRIRNTGVYGTVDFARCSIYRWQNLVYFEISENRPGFNNSVVPVAFQAAIAPQMTELKFNAKGHNANLKPDSNRLVGPLDLSTGLLNITRFEAMNHNFSDFVLPWPSIAARSKLQVLYARCPSENLNPRMKGDIDVSLLPRSLTHLNMERCDLGDLHNTHDWPPSFRHLHLHLTGIRGDIDALHLPNTFQDAHMHGCDIRSPNLANLSALPRSVMRLNFNYNPNLFAAAPKNLDVDFAHAPPGLIDFRFMNTQLHGELKNMHALSINNKIEDLQFAGNPGLTGTLDISQVTKAKEFRFFNTSISSLGPHGLTRMGPNVTIFNVHNSALALGGLLDLNFISPYLTEFHLRHQTPPMRTDVRLDAANVPPPLRKDDPYLVSFCARITNGNKIRKFSLCNISATMTLSPPKTRSRTETLTLTPPPTPTPLPTRTVTRTLTSRSTTRTLPPTRSVTRSITRPPPTPTPPRTNTTSLSASPSLLSATISAALTDSRRLTPSRDALSLSRSARTESFTATNDTASRTVPPTRSPTDTSTRTLPPTRTATFPVPPPTWPRDPVLQGTLLGGAIAAALTPSASAAALIVSRQTAIARTFGKNGSCHFVTRDDPPDFFEHPLQFDFGGNNQDDPRSFGLLTGMAVGNMIMSAAAFAAVWLFNAILDWFKYGFVPGILEGSRSGWSFEILSVLGGGFFIPPAITALLVGAVRERSDWSGTCGGLLLLACGGALYHWFFNRVRNEQTIDVHVIVPRRVCCRPTMQLLVWALGPRQIWYWPNAKWLKHAMIAERAVDDDREEDDNNDHLAAVGNNNNDNNNMTPLETPVRDSPRSRVSSVMLSPSSSFTLGSSSPHHNVIAAVQQRSDNEAGNRARLNSSMTVLSEADSLNLNNNNNENSDDNNNENSQQTQRQENEQNHNQQQHQRDQEGNYNSADDRPIGAAKPPPPERTSWLRFEFIARGIDKYDNRSWWFLVFELVIRAAMCFGPVAAELVPDRYSCTVLRTIYMMCVCVLIVAVWSRKPYLHRALFWATTIATVTEIVVLALLIIHQRTGEATAPLLLVFAQIIATVLACGVEVYMFLIERKCSPAWLLHEKTKRKSDDEDEDDENENSDETNENDSARRNNSVDLELDLLERQVGRRSGDDVHLYSANNNNNNNQQQQQQEQESIIRDYDFDEISSANDHRLVSLRSLIRSGDDDDDGNGRGDGNGSRRTDNNNNNNNNNQNRNQHETEVDEDMFDQLDRRMRRAFHELVHTNVTVVEPHQRYQTARDDFEQFVDI